MKLNNLDLMVAIDKLKPIIFLDTAIRFMNGAEENSSSETSTSLANACFHLRVNGAKGIVGLHHSPKASATHELMTLENTLRGTGDIGAMCDAVHGVRCIDREQLILRIVPVKTRDFEPFPPFHIQGRPFLSETGDFGVLTAAPVSSKNQKLIEAIERNPKSSYSQLHLETGVSKGHIAEIAFRNGWQRDKSTWIKKKGVPGTFPAVPGNPTSRCSPTTPLGVGNGERERNIYDEFD